MKVLTFSCAACAVILNARRTIAADDGELVSALFENASAKLFDGDIEAEFHQVQDAFGKSSAQRARNDAVVSYDASLDEPDQARRRLGAANVDGVTLWSGGVVSFTINDNYGTAAADTQVIRDAMDEITTKTGVKFRAHLGASETKYLSSIDIVNGDSCSSFIGDVNAGKREAQPIQLKGASGTDRSTCRLKGTVMHELLHALGLWHQQSAADRDNHVLVNMDNVIDEARPNFDKLQNTNSWVGYDFGSIMHYKRDTFSKSGADVLTAIDGRTSSGQVIRNEAATEALGQRNGLSAGDAIELQIMYHCHLANPDDSPEANRPPRSLRDLCTERCPCAEQQGGCKKDVDCQGDLYCGRSYGFYEHLGQRAEVVDLHACLKPSLKPSFAPVENSTAPPVITTQNTSPTSAPTTPPVQGQKKPSVVAVVLIASSCALVGMAGAAAVMPKRTRTARRGRVLRNSPTVIREYVVVNDRYSHDNGPPSMRMSRMPRATTQRLDMADYGGVGDRTRSVRQSSGMPRQITTMSSKSPTFSSDRISRVGSMRQVGSRMSTGSVASGRRSSPGGHRGMTRMSSMASDNPKHNTPRSSMSRSSIRKNDRASTRRTATGSNSARSSIAPQVRSSMTRTSMHSGHNRHRSSMSSMSMSSREPRQARKVMTSKASQSTYWSKDDDFVPTPEFIAASNDPKKTKKKPLTRIMTLGF